MRLCDFVEAMFEIETHPLMVGIMRGFPGSVVMEVKVAEFEYDDGHGRILPRHECALHEVGCRHTGASIDGPSGGRASTVAKG